MLTFNVKERPLITDMRFHGMKEIKASDGEVINALALHAGAVLDPTARQTTVRNIEEVYQGKGYLDAKVTFRTVPAREQHGDRGVRRQRRARSQDFRRSTSSATSTSPPANCAARWRPGSTTC